MRYYKSYYDARDAAFNVAKLQAQLEKLKGMDIMTELPNNTVYLKDSFIEVRIEPWFAEYLRRGYDYILSSPKVWNELIRHGKK